MLHICLFKCPATAGSQVPCFYQFLKALLLSVLQRVSECRIFSMPDVAQVFYIRWKGAETGEEGGLEGADREW